MSILFEPMQLGNVHIKNRFVRSATYESMATQSGHVTDEIVQRYRKSARGGVGLTIPGYLYVHPLGRAAKYQVGIHHDDMIPGLKRVVEAVHDEGGKIAFQLVHAGRQTKKSLVGQTPLGPCSRDRDLVYLVKAKRMTEEQIQTAIRAFGEAAGRAVEAGADGVQIHAAHGYLVNQFLSPFFNVRDDAWGGSDENRFRFLKEVVLAIKKTLPEGMPLLIKLNTHDHTPKQGITPPLAVKYAGWLAELGIAGLEVSCGSALYSYMNMCQGQVPVNELVQSLPWWQKLAGKFLISRLVGKYDLQEGYNLEAAKAVRPVIGSARLMMVGGLRRVAHMEDVLEKGYADFISTSRPFIREPMFVKRIQEGKTDAAACVSCNRCLAAAANAMPVKCYFHGFPR